ncbi:hypothetical protein PILCRDRAFT_91200 [Piloderma croceum F 1598]|uniref:Uncharacterized protein n=1 Tax=Piloderma croceum (strain F 1598) TaxID=765440 RepID=A0A0C3FC32_PILCF|nr:hypothetical protein PILCRDRAFT_91200 [Piloderma croceum F 1598]
MPGRVWLILVYPPSKQNLKALLIILPLLGVHFGGEHLNFYLFQMRTFFLPYVLPVISTPMVVLRFRSEIQVLAALFQGARPKRPSDPWVTDALWEFIQHCWDSDQDARLDIKEVNDRMTRFHRICINRERCLTIPSTDGYETDSEAFRSSGQTSKLSGWQSDHESYTKPRKSAKKLHNAFAAENHAFAEKSG